MIHLVKCDRLAMICSHIFYNGSLRLLSNIFIISYGYHQRYLFWLGNLYKDKLSQFQFCHYRKAELNALPQTNFWGYWSSTFISCFTGINCEFTVDSIAPLRFFCFLILRFERGVVLLLKCDEINDKCRIFNGKPSNVLRKSHADNKGILLF